MAEYQGFYPEFNVLNEEKNWDPHTREIVETRIQTQMFFPAQFFTQQETNTLFQLCSVLLDERRSEIIDFVVHHFDSTLQSSIGESQRKVGVPGQSSLIRDGLRLLDQACLRLYGGTLDTLADDIVLDVVNGLVQGNFHLQSGESKVPVKEFMDKIISETVAAYYSHPAAWSEIGYAGPAYPRGYVRTELGLTDPWEARRDGQS